MNESFFAGVEPLVQAGRFKDAAVAVKRSVRAGGDPGESYVWLGRIEEGRGFPREAEKLFRRALAAAPSSPLPRIELSRILEKTGRAGEARTVLAKLCDRVIGELRAFSAGRGTPTEPMRFLWDVGHFRKIFLERLRDRAEDMNRAASGLRAAKSVVANPGVGTLLAEVFMARGDLHAAQKELAESFGSQSAGVDHAGIEALISLIGRGAYGTALERSVLSALAKARLDDRLMLEWPHVFSALMGVSMYHAAFRLGEAVLDKLGSFPFPEHLRCPWRRKEGRALCDERFRARELARVRSAGRGGEFSRWFAYYRAILSGDQGGKKTMAEYGRLRGLSSKRYSWVGQAFITTKLEMLDLDGAIKIGRRVLKGAPSYWWVRCRLAEARLVKGELVAGLAEFELACRSSDLNSRRQAMAWHGEALLWLGEYGHAQRRLDEAVALGAQSYVYGWRGAARLLSGRADGALADLDRAVALDCEDYEARCWRGEAYRLLGRRAEAAADLDEVVRRAPYNFWAHVNRSLLRASMGDARGAAADFASIPKEVAAFIVGKSGASRGGMPRVEEMSRALQAGLDRAKGVRRWERYVQRIWMNSP